MTGHPPPLTVASWNIHKGVGRDRRRDLHRTAEVIAELDADILALQEADTRFGIRTGLLDLDHLEQLTGLAAVPVQDVGPAHGWHGNVILYRKARLDNLHQITLPGFEPRGALMADLEYHGHPLRVIAAHFGLLPGSRAAQSVAILHRLSQLDDRATLLMGDLNEWRTGAGSPLAALHHRLPQAPLVRSFPARMPMLPFDRMMACQRATLGSIEVHDSHLARHASDHLPIRARLTLGLPA